MHEVQDRPYEAQPGSLEDLSRVQLALDRLKMAALEAKAMNPRDGQRMIEVAVFGEDTLPLLRPREWARCCRPYTLR